MSHPVVTTSGPTHDDDPHRPSPGGLGANQGPPSTTTMSSSFHDMLFSPAASSLASAPGATGTSAGTSAGTGGAMHHTGNVSQHQHHQHTNTSHGGGGGGGGGGIELEVHWDPWTVQSELTHATSMLSQRGLKLAAKWAAEQLMGVAEGSVAHRSQQQQQQQQQEDSWMPQSQEDDQWQSQLQLQLLKPHDWYAKSLLDLGEYLHAASVLSERVPDHRGDILELPGPRDGLGSFGIFVRAYAMYMAGERRSEEEHLELQSEAQKQTSARNPYLLQLLQELEEMYSSTPHKLDAFGLYVYGMVLKEAQKEGLTCPHAPHSVLMESLLLFPWNWSAWLDLAEVLTTSSTSSTATSTPDTALEQEVEQVLQPTLATHYMYHFFCAHLMSHHHQAHEDALVLYDRLYEPVPDQPLFTTAYLKSQMGVAHYHLREFEQALEWFHQIHDPFYLEQKDVYSNILYVQEDRVGLSHLAHQAVRIDKYRPETCCIIGNYYSLKQQRQKAVQYFQRALKLDRSYVSAWTLMGHEYVELKQTESAMEAYRRAVTVSPKDYRAWYGLGQTYEFLNMHLYALFYYRKAAMLRPYDARMWCAVGLCLVALHKGPDAIRAYERAVAQEDTEGIATQKLATLYRQEGRTEEAAQCYLRHLELRYLVTNPSPVAPTTNTTTTTTAAAAAAAGNNIAPPITSLDAIVQGVVVDAPEAEALIFLAQYHQSHGEYDTASLLCSRLIEYPGPEKEQAKGLLRDLRSRGRRFADGNNSKGDGKSGGHTGESTTTTTTTTPKQSSSTTTPFEFSP